MWYVRQCQLIGHNSTGWQQGPQRAGRQGQQHQNSAALSVCFEPCLEWGSLIFRSLWFVPMRRFVPGWFRLLRSCLSNPATLQSFSTALGCGHPNVNVACSCRRQLGCCMLAALVLYACVALGSRRLLSATVFDRWCEMSPGVLVSRVEPQGVWLSCANSWHLRTHYPQPLPERGVFCTGLLQSPFETQKPPF